MVEHLSKLTYLLLLLISTSTADKEEDYQLVENETTESDRNLSILPNLLAPDYRLQPREAFVRSVVCVDPSEPDCDDAIFFSNAAVLPPNGFRFQSTGPEALQGTFWLQATGDRASILTSFAETRAGEGIDTGVFEENFEGAVYVKRPVSDQSWAYGFGEETTGGGFSFADLGDSVDGIYRFQLREGTIDSPVEFLVYPTLLIIPLSACVHFRLWNILFDWFFSFRLSLITDPSHPARLAYPGSKVWRRQTLLFFGLFEIPSSNFNYNVVQIIDGSGQPIVPAYNEWMEWVKANTQNRISFDRLKDDRVDDYVDC